MDAARFWQRLLASKSLTYLSYALSLIFVVALLILQLTESPIPVNECPSTVIQSGCAISEDEINQYIRVHDQLAHEYEIIIDKYAVLKKEYDQLVEETTSLRSSVVAHHDDISSQLSAQIADIIAAKAEVLAANSNLLHQHQDVNDSLSVLTSTLSDVQVHTSELQAQLTATSALISNVQSASPAENEQLHHLVNDAVRQVKAEVYRLDILSLVSHQVQSRYQDMIREQVNTMLQSLHPSSVNEEDIRTLVQRAWKEMQSSAASQSSVFVSETKFADFALRGAGATILPHYTSGSYRPSDMPPLQWELYNALGVETGVGRPEEILSHRMDLGRCWAMAGASGTIGIQLYSNVNISSISVSHIPRFEAVDITTAPRDFEVFGLRPESSDYRLLLRGSYDIDTTANTQYFNVPFKNELFSAVVFKVLNNHGNEDYTCIYKVGVHGELVQ